MTVVATTGAWEYSSGTRCWHARCCDDRCVGVQFSNKALACTVLRRQVRGGAFLQQGVGMPVVATTGAWECSSRTRCWHARCCDDVRGSAVLEQGVGMPVVATTGAWGCSSRTRCWHARCCDDRCVGVQFSSKVLACPLLRRQVRSSRTRCWHARCCDDRCMEVDVLLIKQRQVGVSPTVKVPQIQFIMPAEGHSSCATETGTALSTGLWRLWRR